MVKPSKIITVIRRESLGHRWRWLPVRAAEIEVDRKKFFIYHDSVVWFAVEPVTGLHFAIAASPELLQREIERILAVTPWARIVRRFRQTYNEINPGPRPLVALRKAYQTDGPQSNRIHGLRRFRKRRSRKAADGGGV